MGLQMRQSHEIALAEIYQARTNAVMDWNHTLASSEFALGAFEKSASGTQLKISALENRASFAMVTSALFAWENSHSTVGAKTVICQDCRADCRKDVERRRK